MYDCDATFLLNVYIYLVFVGKEYLAQLPSYLPHLRRLTRTSLYNGLCDSYFLLLLTRTALLTTLLLLHFLLPSRPNQR